jgi:glycosyltransferase involved in cell wall biosynthesis
MLAPTPFFGDRGCHVRIYEEAKALAAHDVVCEIVTYAAGGRADELIVRRSRVLWGLQPVELGPSVTRPLLDLQLIRTSSAVARGFQPDVIHAHLHEGIAVGSLLRRRFGIPLVGDLQGSVTEELIDHRFLPRGGPVTSFARAVERWIVRKADAVVVSSPTAADVVQRQGVRAEHITALPDGVDLTRFGDAPRDAALARSLGLDGKKVVAFLGVLTGYQGVDTLIEMVPEVVRRVPDAHFLIMGYPNVERYRAKVRALKLEHVVTLPGRIPYGEAPRYLRLGDVAVSAKQSTTEANGKLLNYMACGLPVVAFETPVSRDLLGPDGVYVNPGDTRRFAEAICDLLEDSNTAAALGRRLRERAQQVHAWEQKIRPLLSVYERVLAAASVTDAIQPQPAAGI